MMAEQQQQNQQLAAAAAAAEHSTCKDIHLHMLLKKLPSMLSGCHASRRP